MMFWNGVVLVLCLSLLINMLFIWYLRQLLGRLGYVCKNIYDLKRTVDLYKKHLDVISELEMFYKDENIEHLKQHTQDLVDQLKTYEEFYELLSTEDISNIPSESELKETEDESRKSESGVQAEKKASFKIEKEG